MCRASTGEGSSVRARCAGVLAAHCRPAPRPVPHRPPLRTQLAGTGSSYSATHTIHCNIFIPDIKVNGKEGTVIDVSCNCTECDGQWPVPGEDVRGAACQRMEGPGSGSAGRGADTLPTTTAILGLLNTTQQSQEEEDEPNFYQVL